MDELGPGAPMSGRTEAVKVDGQQERPASPAAEGTPAGQPNVDVERLADRVYQLMLAEVRLGRARGEPLPGRERAGR